MVWIGRNKTSYTKFYVFMMFNGFHDLVFLCFGVCADYCMDSHPLLLVFRYFLSYKMSSGDV
jgi:hypothetical protein